MQPKATGAIIESRQTQANLQAFHEIARTLTSALDLEPMLAAIMEQVERFARPHSWALLLTDEKRRDLYYAFTDPVSGRKVAGVRVPYGEGISGAVAERGEMLVVPEVVLEDGGMRFDPRLGIEVRSAICIPLRSRLRTLGVIQLFNLPAEVFSDYAISCLTVLSDFAAIAIENARTFERVQQLTIVDECTGLYNLRHFENTLRTELARCDRLATPLSLIFVDLDHFKLVNDRYGHQVGSQLLAAVSATIRAQVRSIDLTFRYGGDEFIILLPGTDKQRAAEVAHRLLLKLRKTVHAIPPNYHLNMRASIGVASYPEDGKSAQELVRTADARMYEIKDAARDGVASTGTVPRKQGTEAVIGESLADPGLTAF